MNGKIRTLQVVSTHESRETGRSEREIAKAVEGVLDAIRPLASDSVRMRALAAASCAHGADDDAAWFIDAARDMRGSRCGRCGRPRR